MKNPTVSEQLKEIIENLKNRGLIEQSNNKISVVASVRNYFENKEKEVNNEMKLFLYEFYRDNLQRFYLSYKTSNEPEITQTESLLKKEDDALMRKAALECFREVGQNDEKSSLRPI